MKTFPDVFSQVHPYVYMNFIYVHLYMSIFLCFQNVLTFLFYSYSNVICMVRHTYISVDMLYYVLCMLFTHIKLLTVYMHNM